MHDERPSFTDIFEEVATMGGGLVAALLPFILLSAPAIFPLLIVGGLALAVVGLVLGLLGAVLAAPLLLVRALRRR